MRTPASIARHPIHPMLITIPIGLWLFSFACDLVYQFGPHDAVWKTVALYAIGGGVVGALLAAVPGLVDLLALPPALRRTALVHMTINFVVAAMFALNFWLRLRSGDAGASSISTVWLSLSAVALLGISGWLGGKLVYEHAVAVDTDG